MTKKLYRSDTNKVFAGVIGGVGEYFDIDPTVLRLGYALISLVTHLIPAVIVYIIATIVVPKKPSFHHMHESEYKEKTEDKKEENN